MKKSIGLGIVLTLCGALCTGCWDMTEPNERAGWIGTGIDKLPNGEFEVSAQILSPRKIGIAAESKDRQDIVKTGIGTTAFDAVNNIQEQVSRKTYLAHRLALFIGERTARSGLKDALDAFGRDPDSNLRADIFVVKGEDAKRFLDMPTGLEGNSTKAALQTSRFSDISRKEAMMHTFLSKSVSEGVRPLALVIEMNPHQKSEKSGQELYNVREIALFDRDIKLVGFLEDNEADTALWIAGALRKTTLTSYMPRGNGTVMVDFQKVKRHIRSVIKGKQITIYLTLSGTGIIRENNSNMDLSKPKMLRYSEQECDRCVEQMAQHVVEKVQKQYGTDNFGLGEYIHRRHPFQWRELRNNWDDLFPRVHVVVNAKIHIRHYGNKGPAYALPTREP